MSAHLALLTPLLFLTLRTSPPHEYTALHQHGNLVGMFCPPIVACICLCFGDESAGVYLGRPATALRSKRLSEILKLQKNKRPGTRLAGKEWRHATVCETECCVAVADVCLICFVVKDLLFCLPARAATKAQQPPRFQLPSFRRSAPSCFDSIFFKNSKHHQPLSFISISALLRTYIILTPCPGPLQTLLS